jgi:hypothetical protein
MVLSNNTLQKINKRKSEINDFLLSPFIPRIKRWIRKSDETDDAFDKYLALFISANMFYNLWAKIKNPDLDYEDLGDGQKYRDTLELIDYTALPFTKEDVSNLIQILKDDNLIVEIKKKENRQWVLDGLAQDKLNDNLENNEKLAEYMWKTIYKIRCNLIHGEKGYEDRQIRLLNQTSIILKKIIEELVIRLNNLILGEVLNE